jgi:hypothetical protein
MHPSASTLQHLPRPFFGAGHERVSALVKYKDAHGWIQRRGEEMAVLSAAYAMLVLALSVAVIIAVWRANKERIKSDLRRLSAWLRLR